MSSCHHIIMIVASLRLSGPKEVRPMADFLWCSLWLFSCWLLCIYASGSCIAPYYREILSYSYVPLSTIITHHKSSTIHLSFMTSMRTQMSTKVQITFCHARPSSHHFKPAIKIVTSDKYSSSMESCVDNPRKQ